MLVPKSSTQNKNIYKLHFRESEVNQMYIKAVQIVMSQIQFFFLCMFPVISGSFIYLDQCVAVLLFKIHVCRLELRPLQFNALICNAKKSTIRFHIRSYIVIVMHY